MPSFSDDLFNADITPDQTEQASPPSPIHVFNQYRYMLDTIPTRNGRELSEIWVNKVGTNF